MGPSLEIPEVETSMLRWQVYVPRRDFHHVMRRLDEAGRAVLTDLYDEMAERHSPGYRARQDDGRFGIDWGGRAGGRRDRMAMGPYGAWCGGFPPPDRTAEARGGKLLREWLSPEQLAQYDRDKCFEVVGHSTGQRYRIAPGRAFNVTRLDRHGAPSEELCFLPDGTTVLGDIMLAQKISLETNERAALKVANRRPVAGANITAAGIDRRWSMLGDWTT
jgi:hypothetical protein